ncbi:aminoglycoside phosphotransferase family protein [Bizionia gelidisalsuginis]|uniref:Aminoglycoside phosphotransferase family protein n=2 Tax=Bizionia TaxID=283785 RepID=A0A8H2LGL8_9FLAO|nr:MULTISPECIES: aminoglycoside phosphotransferase family protein [Bizionia]TYB80184.1 aminoglycoside phosphotransferase family protein [Bizionia saleffrena]TYC17027.1 aminoglycoside phosphotransferase family protein [Bizionia gelidisalsuginis]
MKARLHNILLYYFNEIIINTVDTLQSGLINSTYKAETSQGTFIIQKINQEVFPNIGELLNNKIKVVNYLNAHHFSTIQFLKTKADTFYVDTEDGIWQISGYISSCVQHKIDSPKMASQLGGYLARFHSALTDFPVSELEITIPDFHNTEKRYSDLLASSASALEERRLNAHREMEYITENFESIHTIAEAIHKDIIPQRVVHNDTKVGNFLFSTAGELLTIIDFDTVMPGSVLHDIGDALRTGASTAPEDEQDLTKVGFNAAIYDAFIMAYVKEGQSFLTPEELNAIHFSLPLILLEQACRFLEDYLRNDIYYDVRYDTHNLVRTRTQLHLFKHVKHYLNKQFNIL